MPGQRTRLAAALVPLVACSTFVAPAAAPLSPYDHAELIAYRALTRADFKSSVTRNRDAFEARHIAAQSCLRLVMRPSEIQAHEIVTSEGRYFEALIERPIFFAAFDRNCSSWNAANAASRSEEELLEHEQTHFGIEELLARRLNARADAITRSVYERGDDLGSVRSKATSDLNRVLSEAKDEGMAVQRRFDEQAFGGEREQQRRWYRKVTAELEATTVLARGPQVLWKAASMQAEPPPASVTEPPARAAPSAPVTPSPPPASEPPVPTKGFSPD